MSDVSPDRLRDLLNLDASTGALTWADRPTSDFADWRVYCVWRARYFGQPALISRHKSGYLYGSIGKRKFLAHRVIWAIYYGAWPANQIDHIDGNPANNAISNLRDVNNAENGKNQKVNSRNTSGIMGVVWDKNLSRWQVRLGRKHIGVSASLAEAAAMRKAAELAAGYHPNHGART